MDQSTTVKAKNLLIRISSSSVMGIFHAINSTFLMALGHFAAQVAIVSAPDMPKLQVVFIRCCEQFLFLIPFVLLFDAKVFHSLEKLPTIILISASGYFCYIGLYLILDLIPLSTAIAISGTCPFFASLFSYIILKEKIKCIEISCGIVGLIGVLFIARPTFIFGGTASPGFSSNKTPKQLEILHLIGCGVAVVYGAARALYLVYVRKWRRIITETRGQQVVTVLYPSVFSILITPMIMIAKKDVVKLPAENYGICVLFIVGLLTSLGLMSLTMATKTQNATVIGVIRNLEIVWAFVLQYFVFGYIPSWWNLGGSVLIVCTTIIASLSINGGFSAWKIPASCSVTCGAGNLTYSRSCDNPTPQHGGADCCGERIRTQPCLLRQCPVNGGFSAWSGPTSCSSTCGVGHVTYSRSCDNPTPQYGGVDCVGEKTKTKPCLLKYCEVCYSSKENKYASFTVWKTGSLKAIRLTHISGSLTCTGSYSARWGCSWHGNTAFTVVITDQHNQILFPESVGYYHHYKIEGAGIDDDEITLSKSGTVYVRDGQSLRIWDYEDMKDYMEGDNYGKHCIFIELIYDE